MVILPLVKGHFLPFFGTQLLLCDSLWLFCLLFFVVLSLCSCFACLVSSFCAFFGVILCQFMVILRIFVAVL